MSSGPEPGYYADPSIPGYIRYWDGTQWVAGTSRPAPGQTEPESASSGVADSSGLGGAHTGTAQSAADRPSPGLSDQGFSNTGPSNTGPSNTGQTSTGRHAGGGESRAQAQGQAQSSQLDDSAAWRPSAGPSDSLAQSASAARAESPSGYAAQQQSDALGGSSGDVWTAEPLTAQPQQSASTAQHRSAPPRYDVDPLSQSLPAQSGQRQPQQPLQQPFQNQQQAAAAMPAQQAMPAVQPWQPPTQQPQQAPVQQPPAQPQPQPQQAPPSAQPVDAKPRRPQPVYPEPEPISVATMVVPSAFGNRGAYGAGWAAAASATGTIPKYDPSPFAALPNNGAEAGDEEIAQEESEVIVVELASPGSRILARIIDVAVAAVCSAPVTASLAVLAHRADHAYVQQLRIHATTTYRTLGVDATGFALWGAAAVVLLVTVIGIDAFRTARSGQTSGRRLLGLQVVGAGDAREVGSTAAFTRALTFWVFALLPLIDLLALGGALWGRPYRQGWHEKASRTMTIIV